MGIDRWKQEHRNWRPSGVRLVVPETDQDEGSSAAPSSAKPEQTVSAKPGPAKKPARPSSARSTSASDKAPPKRSKRS